MTIDRLKRVVWRLQEMIPEQLGLITQKELRLAIMEECGTDERTIADAIRKLIELKMLVHGAFGFLQLPDIKENMNNTH